MPNWCDTTYKIVGKEDEVQSLYETLCAIRKDTKSRVENGFGYMWLGNVIDALGGNWEDWRCRGEVIDFAMEDDILVIYQSTAWCEQEGFRQFLEQHYPGIKVLYREEEPGCDVYYTNDETGDYFPDQYILDTYEGQEYFETLGELIGYVRSLTGDTTIHTEEDVEHALTEYEEQQEETNPDVFYCLHKFRYSAD